MPRSIGFFLGTIGSGGGYHTLRAQQKLGRRIFVLTQGAIVILISRAVVRVLRS
jgi:hypothetical protein